MKRNPKRTPKTWEEALEKCKKFHNWDTIPMWARACELLIDKSGVGKLALERDGFISGRGSLNNAMRLGSSIGFDQIAGIVEGTKHTWYDWAEAYFRVAGKGVPKADSATKALQELDTIMQDMQDEEILRAMRYWKQRGKVGFDRRTKYPKVLKEAERKKLIGK